MESTSQESLTLRKYYAELVSILAQYMNELLPCLVSEQMISIKEKNTIKQYGETSQDRAEYLLDNHVERPLSAGVTENFVKLLRVMQKIPGCDKLSLECCGMLNDRKVENNQPGMEHVPISLLKSIYCVAS